MSYNIRRLYDSIDGKKTYIVAVIALIYIWSQVWAGTMDVNTAIEGTIAVLGGAALRDAIKKSEV